MNIHPIGTKVRVVGGRYGGLLGAEGVITSYSADDHPFLKNDYIISITSDPRIKTETEWACRHSDLEPLHGVTKL